MYPYIRMRWKIPVGIIFIAGGLSTGFWEWIKGGFAGAFPALGFALLGIGIYLVLSEIFKREKEVSLGTVGKIAGTAGVLTLSYLLGRLAYDKLSEYFHSKSLEQKLSDEELIALEKYIDSMNIRGQLDNERYKRAKELIFELKRRRGLA